QISTTPNAPPRCLIPHFPDDPKARFLDELNEELPDASSSQTNVSPAKRSAGQWKSAKTLEQFWEMMAFRQECSSGRLVGFIWVVFTPSNVRSPGDTETTSGQMSALSEADEDYVYLLNPIRTERHISAPRTRRKPGLSGPIVTRQPRIKTASFDLSTSSQPDRSQHYTWPINSRGQIVLEEKDYTRARDVLLRLDFATPEVATTGTKRWTDEVAVMAGTPGQWGQRIVGEKVTPKPPGEPGHTPAQSIPNVLDLTSMRKKRKVENAQNRVLLPNASTSDVNVLNGTMIRKKPKPDTLLAELGGSLIFGANAEMVSIDIVRQSNEGAKELTGLVGVFVGATSGIGESTVKELFKRTVRPRIYIVGRNADRGNRIVSELRSLNEGGEVIFIQRDVSLLAHVDEVCKEIEQKEKKIHMLFLTAGFMSLRGRNETPEGIDKKMAVNYYSRMRFAINLMPLITAASAASELSRVITVLAAGSEGDIRLDDLELKHNFTLHACLAHCVVMSDFMVEELASRYPGTAFSHSYPGTVKTGIASELSGPSGISGGAGACRPEGLDVVDGMKGEKGGGAYLLDWDGNAVGDQGILNKYREQGLGPKVWEHTMQIFHQATSGKRRIVDQGGERPPKIRRDGGQGDLWVPLLLLVRTALMVQKGAGNHVGRHGV
ncbi:hypothetical protein B0A49_01686, partial [Cryomyces minteri]